jgi:ankyrin repeat protein
MDVDLFFEYVQEGMLEEVREMLDESPELVNIENENTPLFVAVQAGHLAMVKELLKRGADPDDGDMETPLHVASKAGRLDIMEALLSRADVNAKDAAEWTPLHVAAAAGQLRAARLLLDKGASTEARTEDGQTPIELAQTRRHPRVQKLIESFIMLRNLNSASKLRRVTLKNSRRIPNNALGVVGSFLSGQRAAETNGPHRGRVRKETMSQQRKRLRDAINALA